MKIKKTEKKTKAAIQRRKPKRVSAKLRNIDLRTGNTISAFPRKIQDTREKTFEPKEKLERQKFIETKPVQRQVQRSVQKQIQKKEKPVRVKKPRKPVDKTIILLVVLLIVLLGGLAVLFLFRDNLMTWIKNLFP